LAQQVRGRAAGVPYSGFRTLAALSSYEDIYGTAFPAYKCSQFFLARGAEIYHAISGAPFTGIHIFTICSCQLRVGFLLSNGLINYISSLCLRIKAHFM